MDASPQRNLLQLIREFLARRFTRRDLARSVAFAAIGRATPDEQSTPQPGDSRHLQAGPEASGHREVLIGHDDPNEKNGFRVSHRSAWGDTENILTVASHNGLPPMSGEYDLDIGDLGGFLRKIDFRVSAGLADQGVVHGPSRVSTVHRTSATTFTDTSLTQPSNAFAPSRHQTFVVVFTTGANAGKARWIASNANGQIVCGTPFGRPIAAGDTYAIRRFAIPAPANSPQLTIWHGTDDSGNSLPYVCFDVVESLSDQGARHRFEPTHSTFRDYLAIMPSGTHGVYDIRLGMESGIWRDLVLETNGMPNALRLLHSAKRWELNAGINMPSRDVSRETDLEPSDIFVYGDAADGEFSIRLPDPSTPGHRNGMLFIKNRGSANRITLAVRGEHNTIDGAPTKTLAPGQSVMAHARSTSDYATFAM